MVSKNVDGWDDLPTNSPPAPKLPMTASNFHKIWIELGSIRYSVGGKKATIKARSDQDLERLNAGSTCLVCSSTADTFYYGTRSCANCSEFFCKTVLENLEYSCSTGGKCRVSHETLHQVCCACRMRKCIFNGMNIGAVKPTDALKAPSNPISFTSAATTSPLSSSSLKIENKLVVNTAAVTEFREHVTAAHAATGAASVKARDAVACEIKYLVNALIRVGNEIVEKIDEQVFPKQQTYDVVLKRLEELEKAVQSDNFNSTETYNDSVNKLSDFVSRNDAAKNALIVEYNSTKAADDVKRIARLFGSISANGSNLQFTPSNANDSDYFPVESALSSGSNLPSTSSAPNSLNSSSVSAVKVDDLLRNGNSDKLPSSPSQNGVRGVKESNNSSSGISCSSTTPSVSRWSKPLPPKTADKSDKTSSSSSLAGYNKPEKQRKASDHNGGSKRKVVDDGGDSRSRGDVDEDIPKKKSKKLERIIHSSSPASTNSTNTNNVEEEEDRRARLERLYEKQERKRLRRLEAEKRGERASAAAEDRAQTSEKQKKVEKNVEELKRKERENSTVSFFSASKQNDSFLAKRATPTVLSSRALPNTVESVGFTSLSKQAKEASSAIVCGEVEKKKEKHKENRNVVATAGNGSSVKNTAISTSHPSMKNRKKEGKSGKHLKGLSSPGAKLERRLLKKNGFKKVTIVILEWDVEETISRYKDTILFYSHNPSSSGDLANATTVESGQASSCAVDSTAPKASKPPPLINFITADTSKNSTKTFSIVSGSVTAIVDSWDNTDRAIFSEDPTAVNAQSAERKRKATSQPLRSTANDIDNDGDDENDKAGGNSRSSEAKKQSKAASAQPDIDGALLLASDGGVKYL